VRRPVPRQQSRGQQPAQNRSHVHHIHPPRLWGTQSSGAYYRAATAGRARRAGSRMVHPATGPQRAGPRRRPIGGDRPPGRCHHVYRSENCTVRGPA
jgi:hypothetical protein